MNPMDAQDIVVTLGTLGVIAALFIETGLLLGLLLPGDSLLFVAGLAASGTAREILGDQLSYAQLLICAPIAATAGSQFGYWLGAKFGKDYLIRPDSRFFNLNHIDQAEQWLMKYGFGKALILSHFVPFIRTLLNPLCGIMGIPARKFLIWNIVGSCIWTIGIISLGFFLGERLHESIHKFLLPLVFTIVLISLLPIFKEIFLRKTKSNV